MPGDSTCQTPAAGTLARTWQTCARKPTKRKIKIRIYGRVVGGGGCPGKGDEK